MFQFKLLLICLTISCCYGFRIHFEQEDDWIDDAEIYGEARNQKIQWIFPGTKWCGTGDTAENDNDLGTAVETDMCCRTHDHCDDIIEAGESKNNLTNDSFYTKLNCGCDERFYDCLKATNTKTGKAVGHIYFNVLGTQCYRKDYPIVRCLKYHGITQTRCVEYELNMNAPKIWEWFDVPLF